MSAFSKAELSFPILFVELPVYSHLSQQVQLQASSRSFHHAGVHCAVANIAKEFTAPLQTDSKFVHCAVAIVDKRPLTDLSAPLHWQFVSKQPTALRDGAVTLKARK